MKQQIERRRNAIRRRMNFLRNVIRAYAAPPERIIGTAFRRTGFISSSTRRSDRFSNIVPRLVRVVHTSFADRLPLLEIATNTFRNASRQAITEPQSFPSRGRAIIERETSRAFPDWAKANPPTREINRSGSLLETRVSQYIGNLRVLAIPVLDSAGKSSMRATIERQSLRCSPNTCAHSTPQTQIG